LADHASREFCRLFEIISRSSGNVISGDPLCHPAPKHDCDPIESSWSMKMMEGASFFALLNMSLTRDAPTPTNISMNSEPLML
jgi:hypothetical protein